MITFHECSTEYTAAEWDNKLLGFKDFNFQQTHAFGELGRTGETEIYRWLLLNGDQVLVMAQGFMRKTFFGMALLMIRGGPVYRASENDAVDLKNLRVFLDHLLKANRIHHRFFYLNMIMNSERSVVGEIVLREAGMRRPFFERAPYLTYIVPVQADPDRNMKAFDAKWRNQLRRAESQKPEFTWGADEALLKRYVALHNTMCRIKSIGNFSLTEELMMTMRRHLGEHLQFLVGSVDGHDVCGCAVVIVGNRAFYYYAAANEQGRTGYLSNAMVWRLIQRLQQMNVSELDLSGIDPAQNWGGYHFKKGIGGRAFAYQGEWDYSSHGFVKPLVNLALFRRARQMYR